MSAGITALAIGDPHLRSKYITIVDEFIAQTLEIIKSQKPHFVVVLGDTLHHHEQARESCHSRAVKWFIEMAKYAKLYVLIGNHDRPNNSHFLTENHFFNGLKGHDNIVVVDKVHSMDASVGEKKYRFIFVPYVPPGKFQAALDTLDISIADETPKAIFAHQEFKGVKMGAIASEVGDEWSEEKPFVISGHIHEYQCVGNNIMYVGTPYQTTFAEANNKGVFLFTFGEKNNAKRIRLKLRVKQKIVLQAKDVEKWVLPNTEEDVGGIDLRIDIVGKKDEIQAVKQLPAYKIMQETDWITVVLRPELELPNTANDYTRVSFMELLLKTVDAEPELKELCSELLRDVQ